MAKMFKKISKAQGLVPGTLVHIGDETSAKVKITIIDYNDTAFEEKEVKLAKECFVLKKTDTASWINIDGIHDLATIEQIGACFELHPLILEDIANTSQRPKMEDFETYISIALKMLKYNETAKEIESEHVSLILGPNFVLSFQEREGDVFESVRERIRNGKGRIRKMGPDYLAYTLIDAIVDHYFVILEKIGEKIETMEDELVQNPIPKTLQTIHHLKQDAIFLRKAVWPLREVISGVQRSESKLIKKTTAVFLRDLYDHTIQVIDTI
ncbi:magnesium and cobalt transport protein CorA, partial [Candidatus Omnitrophota bacterium]